MDRQQLLDLVESIVAWIDRVNLFPIAMLFSLIGLSIGIFLVMNPALTIEIQRRFYEKINWKMEPVSMSKEIRNTRIMGAFLIVILVSALVFIFSNSWLFQ